MRILMLSEAPYPEHGGGAGKFAYLLAAGLVRRGHAVHLLWCGGNQAVPPYSVDGIEIHRVPSLSCDGVGPRDREYLTAKSHLAEVQARIPMPVDVVHDTCGFWSAFFPLAQWLQQLYSVPLITHFEFLQYRNQMVPTAPLDSFSRAHLYFEARRHEMPQCFAVRISDKIICPCQDEADFVQTIYCPAPGSLHVLPNPVELPQLSSESVQAARNKIGRPGERLVLFGGRIGTDQKNSGIVLKALRRLRTRYPQVRLVLATNDEAAVNPFRQALGEAITWVGWIRDAREMAEILAAVDAAVMPSRYESFGQIASEAMASATPVVASPVGAMPELIRDGENGFILGPDPRQWCRELEERLAILIEDGDRAREMGRRARRTVEDTITVERVSAQLENLYGELLQTRHSLEPRRPALPALSPEDRELYLQSLARRGGDEARRAGERVLARWPLTAERRCLACTHHRIATDTKNLLRLPRARWWNWLPWLPSWPETVHDVVANVCPLALLQKEHLHSGQLRSFAVRRAQQNGIAALAAEDHAASRGA